MSAADISRYRRIVQAFWDPEPKNDVASGSHIWCLGIQYSSQSTVDDQKSLPDELPIPSINGAAPYQGDTSSAVRVAATRRVGDESEEKTGDIEADKGWPTEFLDDCESRLWFTYRSNFPSIKKSSDASISLSVRLRSLGDQGGFTTDTGWGCMIRSGQSLLANALLLLRLGRGWRRSAAPDREQELLSLFADDPSAPFSIHRFVEHGALACGKYPGEWFGPSATSRCIQALSHTYPKTGLKVYVNGDGADVYEDTFFKLAKTSNELFTPTLILLGIRLGIDRITPLYWEALKASLRMPQSVGIAGGRPSSSHYFFGCQGNYFFYLDPHITRPALRHHSDSTNLNQEAIDSCHTRRLRRIALKDMDPSMLIAFLIRDEVDWRNWRDSVCSVPGKPIVHVTDLEPSFHEHGTERSAVDDVAVFDDEGQDEGDGELVERSHE